MDLFFKNFSHAQIGQRPKLVSIDGGKIPSFLSSLFVFDHGRIGILQTDQTGPDFNLESSLDLQYSMGLVGKNQQVTLFQVGDVIESMCCRMTEASVFKSMVFLRCIVQQFLGCAGRYFLLV